MYLLHTVVPPQRCQDSTALFPLFSDAIVLFSEVQLEVVVIVQLCQRNSGKMDEAQREVSNAIVLICVWYQWIRPNYLGESFFRNVRISENIMRPMQKINSAKVRRKIVSDGKILNHEHLSPWIFFYSTLNQFCIWSFLEHCSQFVSYYMYFLWNLFISGRYTIMYFWQINLSPQSKV